MSRFGIPERGKLRRWQWRFGHFVILGMTHVSWGFPSVSLVGHSGFSRVLAFHAVLNGFMVALVFYISKEKR